MSPKYETLDLALLEGVTTYIEQILCKDIRKAFAMRGSVSPYGVALGTLQNGTKLPRPQAMAVGAYGMGLRNTKRSLRKLAKNSGATGVILVQMNSFKLNGHSRETEIVAVQLEHKEFGDLVWTAVVKDSALGSFKLSSLADASHTIPKTALMPNRWMH